MRVSPLRIDLGMKKRPLQMNAEDGITVVPPHVRCEKNAASAGPISPRRCIGRARHDLLAFRFEPCRSERYFPAGFPLPCTTRQLSEGTVPDAYFVFVIAFGMDETLPLFWLNVNPIGQKTGEKHQGFTLDPLLRGEAAQG